MNDDTRLHRMLALPQRILGYFWARDCAVDRGSLGEEAALLHARRLDQAEAFLAAARQLADGRRFETAWFNYHQAALALCQATLLVSGVVSGASSDAGEPTPNTASELEPFERLGRVQLDMSPTDRWLSDSMLDALSSPPAAAIPARELKRRCERADRALETWLARLPLKSPARIRAIRWVRITTASLVLLLLPVGHRVYQLYPRNLVYGRPVVASSIDKGTPAGLVDDYYYGLPPFVSKRERHPSVTIDLGRVHLVSDARVMGRHDCCYDEGLPLVFEISVDGTSFKSVGKRTDPFEVLEPWIVTNITRPARYVRVRSEKTTVLALTEIAVFGRP